MTETLRPPGTGRGTATGLGRRGWVTVATTAAVCLVVGGSRLPFLRAPLSSDEAGYLVIGAHWSPGTSLYGNYWVARPPLLIAVFAVADGLGGPVAVRWIGVAAVVLAICAAAAVGWYASLRRTAGAVAAAWVVAALLATPLFGAPGSVNGELLASPLILGGLAALLASRQATTRTRTLALSGLAGALGASAFLVKQNMLDVFVVAGVLGVHTLWRRGLRPAALDLLPVVAGAGVAASAAIALAADRGTSLTGLWEAVFTFRHEASGRLAFVGPRQLGLVRHYVVTGALAVTVVSGAVCFSSRRRVRALAPSSPPWATAAIVLTCWELAAAVAGGDAWSHYLIGVVPGVALLTAVALRAPGKVGLSLLTACLLYAGVAAAVAWSMEQGSPRSPSDDQVAASYVRDHARPGDSVVVAFGHADIVQDTGLPSAYPYLWGLPAHVKDPNLTALKRVLRSPAAPRWFVLRADLSRWGPTGAMLQRTLNRQYSVALRTRRWVVLRRDQATTP